MTYGWGTERAKKGPKFLFIELNVLRDFLGRDLGHRYALILTLKQPKSNQQTHDEIIFETRGHTACATVLLSMLALFCQIYLVAARNHDDVARRKVNHQNPYKGVSAARGTDDR